MRSSGAPEQLHLRRADTVTMMKTAGFVFIACFALSALTLADARKSKPSATVSPASDFGPSSLAPNTTTTATTTVAPNTTTAATTTLAPNTTTTATTTLAPNTTTLAPNTTTTATTTLAPNTTTLAPNTTTTATTTLAPNTTTTATTTVAPTTTAPPSPTPTPGEYNLTNGNKTCLKAKVVLQIRLANKTFTVQPKETTAKGSCDETRVSLNLTFPQGFINFNFTRNITNNTVYMDAVAFTLNYPLTRGRLAGPPYSGSNTSLHLFPAKIGHSYSCTNDSLYMGSGLYLDVTNDQMQAFNLTNNNFGSSDPCPADRPDYRVAIAVGIVLLVLIIVVVVVYLLSRRKRMEGYQSL